VSAASRPTRRRTRSQVDAFAEDVAVETLLEAAILRAGGIMPLIIARAGLRIATDDPVGR
jgi:hypothetical protein